MPSFKIEMHLLQNFAPSCLNRDDTNTPKTCEFGGATRARVSSQSWKRAVRKSDIFVDALAGKTAVRTRRLVENLAEVVSGQQPVPISHQKVMHELFVEAGLLGKKDKDSKEQKPDKKAEGEGGNDKESALTLTSKVLVYMPEDTIQEMAAVLREKWPELAQKNSAARSQVVAQMAELLEKNIQVPDLALFGRMIEISGDTPFGKRNLRVDAACQVAHAISTHKADYETDFYTAVDDLTQSKDEVGAGMLGTQGFNAACFYRYALVDHAQLVKNMGGDTRAANNALEAFLKAFTLSIPNAKQNSHAAQNLPSFGLLVAREQGVPVSLANAFAVPVYGANLIEDSKEKLCKHHAAMDKLYALYEGATQAVFHSGEDDTVLRDLKPFKVDTFALAVDAVMGRIDLSRKGGA